MKIVLFANTDWFLFNFKRSLAQALREQGHEVILLSPPGNFGPRLQEAGFRWEVLPVSRSGVNPLQEWLTIRKIRRLYRVFKPDLVHHFTIKCVIYGSFAARDCSVPRIVNSVTGLGFALLADTFKARMIRPVVLALYRRALRQTRVIFQNHDNLHTLQAYGVLKQSVAVVIPGDGIDTSYFQPLSKPSAPLIVLMMARLLHSKGVADFVEAARVVREKMPQVRFQLAGSPDPGNPESIDMATLDTWQKNGVVDFLGQRSDVLALNQSAAVVVLPSTQGEGIPRALLEGAACGVPMVATDVPGSREVVVSDECGYLVPPSAPQALANAILVLLQDDALRQRMGRVARERVEKVYSDHRIIAQTCEVYASDTPESIL